MAPEPKRPVTGHKRPECTGRWIGIGTMSDPWLQKCDTCYGTRRTRGDQDTDPEPLLEEAAHDEDEPYGVPTGTAKQPMPRWVMYVLVAVGTALACWAYSNAQ